MLQTNKPNKQKDLNRDQSNGYVGRNNAGTKIISFFRGQLRNNL